MEKLSLSVFNIFSLLSLFATVLFIFQLYLSKKKNKTNKYFSFYLISISIIIFFFFILDLEYKNFAMGLLPIFTSATLLIGPLLWFYVRSVVGGGKMRIFNHLFIPIAFGALSFIFLILIYIDFNNDFTGFLSQLLTYLTIGALTVVFIFQNGYYVIKCLKLYKRHLNRVGEVFSYTEKVNLNWLKLIVYGYLVFVLCLILSNVLDDIWSDILFNTILLAYIIYSGNNALNYDPVFDADVAKHKSVSENEIDIKSDFFEKLKKQLAEVMIDERLFLDDSLTIHSLASELNTNSKYLSQLINTGFNKSFVVYVNEFRVEEAKLLLLNDLNKNLTIEAIGYEAGFKSKSAFNSAFKKYAGETPSSFIKKGK